MAQQVRAPAALAEDLAVLPSTHRAAHSHLSLKLQGTTTLQWPLWTRHKCSAQTCMQENSQTHGTVRQAFWSISAASTNPMVKVLRGKGKRKRSNDFLSYTLHACGWCARACECGCVFGCGHMHVGTCMWRQARGYQLGVFLSHSPP